MRTGDVSALRVAGQSPCAAQARSHRPRLLDLVSHLALRRSHLAHRPAPACRLGRAAGCQAEAAGGAAGAPCPTRRRSTGELPRARDDANSTTQSAHEDRTGVGESRAGRTPMAPRESPATPPARRRPRHPSVVRVAQSSRLGSGASPPARSLARCTASGRTTSSSAPIPQTLPGDAARERTASSSSFPASRGGPSSSGSRAREPSFHVFVAAEPEVMIEDDIVRYATQLRRATRPTAERHRLRPRLRSPRGAAPLILPAGVRAGARRARWTRSSNACRTRFPTVVEGDEFKRRAGAARERARGEEPRGHSPARVAREDPRLRRPRRCTGGVQTFPILHGKPVSAEQFDVLDDSTKRALDRGRGASSRARSRRRRSSSESRARGFEAAREEAFSQAAAGIIDARDGRAASRASAPLGAGRCAHWLERVQQALVEDWDDLVELEDEHGAGAALAARSGTTRSTRRASTASR